MENNFENFVGKFEEKTGQYGTFYSVGFGPEDLKKLNAWAAANPKGWVNLTLSTSKNGKLIMKKNDFKPQPKQGVAPTSAPTYQPTPNEVLKEVNGDELPF